MSKHNNNTPNNNELLTVAVITGSRADYALLKPVMQAIANHNALNLKTIVTGTHILADTKSITDIKKDFRIDAIIPMQHDNEYGRNADVQALARGIAGMESLLTNMIYPKKGVILVLGDRIEAFAAAIVGSVGGMLVAHIHGGDRAEGVADEAMRHAITKLAHIHFPATTTSANRIIAMGENPQWVFNVGSPAIDGLDNIEALNDEQLTEYGLDPHKPFAVVLHHPLGKNKSIEAQYMISILNALQNHQSINQYVILAPNHDPGREGICEVLELYNNTINHLPRSVFIALLKRSSMLIGNSSAGLIEAAALNLPVVNIGNRQRGRERCNNVIDVPEPDVDSIKSAVNNALELQPVYDGRFGKGDSGLQIADNLSYLTTHQRTLSKYNMY